MSRASQAGREERRAPLPAPERIEDRFGRNVAAARAHKRLGQCEVAERAGFTQSYMSLIEAGKRTIGIDDAERIAKALDVPVGTLMSATAPFTEEP